MNLFTKNITEISFVDIDNFCNEQPPEGIKIEYKKDFPANKTLAKEIAAFANTNGGIILIGVEEDDDRKPVLPLEGVEKERGLDEKITSICLKNIDTPVFPEIQICPLDNDANKVIVLIRVQESAETPHLINQRTDIYIRVASQSEPVKAKWEDIEWLRNKREKAVQNRFRLIERARTRFERKTGFDSALGYKVVYVTPLYPASLLLSTQTFDEGFNRTLQNFNHSFSDIDGFPYLNEIANQSESRIYTRNIDHIPKHLEISLFGLIFHAEGFWETSREEHSGEINLDLASILYQLYLVLTYSKYYFEEFGYWGSIEIGFTMSSIKNRPFIFDFFGYYRNHNRRQPTTGISPYDNTINIKKTTTIYDLNSQLDMIVTEFYEELLWSCNIESKYFSTGKMKEHLDIVKKRIAKQKS